MNCLNLLYATNTGFKQKYFVINYRLMRQMCQIKTHIIS